MSTSNIQGLASRYNNHFEAWKKVQIAVQINLKALAIILQKFLLFSLKDSADEGSETVDRIIKSYQNKEDESEANLAESYSAVFEECCQSKLDSLPSDSVLVCSLIVNHPGTITLFLQEQSNKLLQMISEISCLYDTFRSKHLAKMTQIREECEVIINRNINIKTHDLQEEKERNSQQINFIVETFHGISEEINEIKNFCKNMDTYPNQEDKIKKYLEFLENFKFFKK
ncbi:hypothetical protein TOT_020000694 [Theileria orientalis strain Shintoku]|uniref:Uncharacterized protein n=1 Tax=Theileria orientalis strain Shintoku TaxID=869250 RepID=J4C8A3_THEOR|nr:hypothetical protein TOT_020000694 [Theileria orientalis strain Shintoku]BAM40438.1 hypothetical protein TOT_020000694 [Theileria orientalis strain Shintoku]|eukprot:XP_009690739.1 hypothetical protein TOT_020000694 [Theileria orientalis strain Shintoku]